MEQPSGLNMFTVNKLTQLKHSNQDHIKLTAEPYSVHYAPHLCSKPQTFLCVIMLSQH